MSGFSLDKGVYINIYEGISALIDHCKKSKLDCVWKNAQKNSS